MMTPTSRIYVAGHRGLVGSAIVRALEARGFSRIIMRTHSELNLSNTDAVQRFFEREKPEYVFLAAAKVGGILANNTYPTDFIRENILIQTNIIHSSYLVGAHKLLFLGSSCIYPKFAPQPIKEEYLLDGKLEPTNEPYAIAKISGIIMCQAYNRQFGTSYICPMPTNLYGPQDNFDLRSSHVLPALIRKFVEAKEGGASAVEVWGSGTPRREFLYVDDVADACLYLMEKYDDPQIINVGVGEDISIRDLALLIKSILRYEGDLNFDASQPDGTPQKLLDVSRLRALGWRPKISLEEGIRRTVDWFVGHRVVASM